MRMGKNKEIDPARPVIIVVEGLDYLYLLLSQIKDRSEFERVCLWDFAEGADLSTSLDLLKSQRNFDSVQAIGIIRDTESNRDAMRESIRSSLSANSLPAPEHEQAAANGPPSIAYLLIPHDEPSGCLEHACLKAAVHQPRLACLTSFEECIATNGAPVGNPNHQAKVRVHAHIAGSAPNPAMTLGQSATAGLWDFNHPSLKVMLDFIRLVRDSVAKTAD